MSGRTSGGSRTGSDLKLEKKSIKVHDFSEKKNLKFVVNFSSKINTREESPNVEEEIESLVTSAHQPEEHPVCVVQVENRVRALLVSVLLSQIRSVEM